VSDSESVLTTGNIALSLCLSVLDCVLSELYAPLLNELDTYFFRMLRQSPYCLDALLRLALRPGLC
jgi:hypothetical protein